METDQIREALLKVCGELLEKDGEIHLTLRGNCMWPVLRDSDRVTLKKIPYHDLKFCDVAVFQTTPQTFHANTQFRNLKPREITPENYVGKIVSVTREGKEINLEKRSFGKRLWQALLSPANPYGLGLPQTIGKKLRKFRQ